MSVAMGGIVSAIQFQVAGRKGPRRVELMNPDWAEVTMCSYRLQMNHRKLTARNTALPLAASQFSELWRLIAARQNISCESSCNLTGLQDGLRQVK